MKKSRILSMLIAVVFVLSSVAIPAFAAVEYKYGDPASVIQNITRFIAPIEGLPFHVAHTVNDPNATYALNKTADELAANVAQVTGVNVDANGLFSIPYNAVGYDVGYFATINATDLGLKVVTTTGDGETIESPKYTMIHASHEYDFETTPVTPKNGNITYGSIVEDANGNHYAGKTSAGYIQFAAQNQIYTRGATASDVVLEFDAADVYASMMLASAKVLGTGDHLNIKVDAAWAAEVGATADYYNPNLANYSLEGWHNYKFVFSAFERSYNGVTHGPCYTLFIDGVKMLENAPIDRTAAGLGSASKNFKFYTKTGMDNYKAYSTTLGFAHEVSIDGVEELNAVGDIITADAQHYRMLSNVPERLVKTLYISDTEAGPYTSLESATLELTQDHAGKYIKAAAYVEEYDIHNCATEPIYTEPVQINIPEPEADPVEWKIQTKAQGDKVLADGTYQTYWVYAPSIAGRTFNLPYEITGGTDTDAVTFTTHANYDASSVSIQEIGSAKKVLVKVGTPSQGAYTETAAHGMARLSGAIVVKNTQDVAPEISYTVRQYGVDTFDDGLTYGWTSANIASDGEGREYVISNPLGEMTKRPQNATASGTTRSLFGTIAHDFDLYIGGQPSAAYENPGNWNKGWRIETFGQEDSGYVFDPYAGSEPVYVGTGWKHVTVFCDLDEATYSIFCDGKPVTLNREVGLVDATKNGYIGARLYVQGELDNYTLSNVTFNTPEIYNAKITNPAAGKALEVDYDLWCGEFYKNDASVVEYLISDTINGTYTAVAADYVPDAYAVGKYVKARITPKANHVINGEIFTTYTGTAVETAPARIGDVAIGAITLKVDGVAKDINSNAITDGSEGTTTVELTVAASSTRGENVKFILAKYDPTWKNIEKIDVLDQTLTQESANYTLTIADTSTKGDYFYYKLFILTESGLIPVALPTYIN